MPRKLPQYVIREKSRHKRVVLYFRQGKGLRIRLPDDMDSPEFEEAYQKARQGIVTRQEKRRERQDTLAWLIGQYERSTAYAALKRNGRHAARSQQTVEPQHDRGGGA